MSTAAAAAAAEPWQGLRVTLSTVTVIAALARRLVQSSLTRQHTGSTPSQAASASAPSTRDGAASALAFIVQ